jgi:hypothetical protein
VACATHSPLPLRVETYKKIRACLVTEISINHARGLKFNNAAPPRTFSGTLFEENETSKCVLPLCWMGRKTDRSGYYWTAFGYSVFFLLSLLKQGEWRGRVKVKETRAESSNMMVGGTNGVKNEVKPPLSSLRKKITSPASWLEHRLPFVMRCLSDTCHNSIHF